MKTLEEQLRVARENVTRLEHLLRISEEAQRRSWAYNKELVEEIARLKESKE